MISDTVVINRCLGLRNSHRAIGLFFFLKYIGFPVVMPLDDIAKCMGVTLVKVRNGLKDLHEIGAIRLIEGRPYRVEAMN